MRTEKAVYLEDFPKNIQATIWKLFRGQKFVSFQALSTKIYVEIGENEKKDLRELVEKMEEHGVKILIQF